MGRHIERNKPRSGKDSSRAVRTKPGRPGKPKVCVFCASKAIWVDYKDVNVLRRLMSDRGKIKARRVTGTCRQHQRDVAIAIKTARELALLPYALMPANSDKSRRGGGSRDGKPSFRGNGDTRGSDETPPEAGLEDVAGEDTDELQAEGSDSPAGGTGG